MKYILLAVPIAIGALLLAQVPGRGIDPDELEHLHAACAVSWGEVPYRDFFEHHAPALYYLLQPVLQATGAKLPALGWSRLLMWALGMGTLALTAAIAHRASGKKAAALAPTLLACTTIFFWKAIEVRPDVPAMFLIAMSAYVLVAAGDRWTRSVALLVGLSLGLATLFTQKAIVPAAALALAEMSFCRHGAPNGRGFGNRLIRVLYIGLGGVATWSIALGLFSTAGAAREFQMSALIQLFNWPVSQAPSTALRPTLLADLPLWLATAAAVVAACVGVGTVPIFVSTKMGLSRFRPRQSYGCRLLAFAIVPCFLGALVIKAAYAQYYLLWFPLAAVVAADALVHWPIRRFLAPVALLFVLEAAAVVYAIGRGADGALPHALERFSTVGVGAAAIAVFILLGTGAVVCGIRGRRTAAVLCLVALGFGYAALRNLDALCWSNRQQVAKIAVVNRLVGPGETVLDGYTGFGAFRRHAYYYWWLNRYSLALMAHDRREEDFFRVIRQAPPKIVCFDENLAQLPPPVQAWIKRHYHPVDPPIYLRN
jgi:4-amino-4-deoxy-L-arabinose transferase-like glycosyltransferase